MHLYAYILFEKEDYGSAEKFLNFGLKYNPIDLHLLFEKNEINKIRKDWGNYKKINDFCIKVSYLSSDIARAYRNYGYMFIELKDYDAAICSYLMSVQYEKSEHANSQLLYISQVKKKNINFKKYMKKIEKILNKRSVQVGPSEEVIGTAVAVGKIYENDNQIEEALYFYGIAYSITDDSDLLQKIKGIQEKLAQ